MTVNDFIKVIDKDSISNLIIVSNDKKYVFSIAESIYVGELGEKVVLKIELETVDYDGWIDAILYVE